MTIGKGFVRQLGAVARRGWSPELRAIRLRRARDSARCAVLIGSLLGASGTPGSPPQPAQEQSNPGDSADSIRARVRAEAAKLDETAVSPLFAATTDASADPALRLRSRQVELCRKLASLTREINRAWLLRGLDAEPPPDAGQLAARLAERGANRRAEVVVHAEALILAGVLDPEQAQAWYKASKTRPRPGQPGRYTPRAMPAAESLTTAQLIRCVQQDAENPRDLGGIFDLIPGAFSAGGGPAGMVFFPDLDTKRQPPANDALRKLNPTPQQIALSKRLESMAQEIAGAWMARGLGEAGSVPAREALAGRLRDQPLFVNNLLTHAELIALNAILTQEQAERVLAVLWSRLGTASLFDPALAALLKLTPQQRDAIRETTAAVNQLHERLAEEGQPIVAHLGDHPELIEQHLQNDRTARRQIDAAEGEVWNLLTPAQMKILKRIQAANKDLDPDRQASRPR